GRQMRRELGERACAHEGRRVRISGDHTEQGRGVGLVAPCRVEGFGVVLEAFWVCSVPALDRRRRPLRHFVAVAVVAGVRRAELRREVGPRHAEAVIVAAVDDHVGALRHVAGRAGDRRAYRLMMAVANGCILVGRVALQADAVAGRAESRGGGLVAIAAGDAGREHLALLERAVIVDLVAHLTVGMIEPARARGGDVGVRQRAAGHPILGKCAAAGVTAAAGLDLLAHRGGRGIAPSVAGRWVDPPADTGPLIEGTDEPLPRVVVSAEGPPALPRARPSDVARALPVTGLAADADLGPGGGEAIGCRVVVLAHAGRVALRAHEVPVLV